MRRLGKQLRTVTFVVACCAFLPDCRDDQHKSGPAQALSPNEVHPGSASRLRKPRTGIKSASLGINLAMPSDWSTAEPFIDHAKSARWWGPDGTHEHFDFDERGWVKSLGDHDVHLIWASLSDVPGAFSNWSIRYDGRGELAYPGGTVVSTSRGHDVVTTRPGRGSLRIVATEPDYIRNIRIVPVELEALVAQGKTFNPRWLTRIEQFRALRFMDWMHTNGSTQARWSDRPLPDDASWAKQGVPVEIMVRLANTVGADPWFTLPHRATPEYLRGFATIVKRDLKPELIPYVEHSNEVWNGIFQQARDCETEGLAARPDTEPRDARLYCHAEHSSKLFQAFEQVFGDRQRFVSVIASHAARATLSERLLQHPGVSEAADALAIAPYFGSFFGAAEHREATLRLGVTGIVQKLRRESLPRAESWMRRSADVAQRHGLQLLAYEGGQHLVAEDKSDTQLVELFKQVNRSAAMQQLYVDYLTAWKKHGGLFMAYLDVRAPNKHGSWGALEFSTQDSSPKWRALETANRWPCWWAGC